MNGTDQCRIKRNQQQNSSEGSEAGGAAKAVHRERRGNLQKGAVASPTIEVSFHDVNCTKLLRVVMK